MAGALVAWGRQAPKAAARRCKPSRASRPLRTAPSRPASALPPCRARNGSGGRSKHARRRATGLASLGSLLPSLDHVLSGLGNRATGGALGLRQALAQVDTALARRQVWALVACAGPAKCRASGEGIGLCAHAAALMPWARSMARANSRWLFGSPSSPSAKPSNCASVSGLRSCAASSWRNCCSV